MAAAAMQSAERRRLEESADRVKNWQRWGPYLSERQWGTVREDYSADGSAWNYFSHDQARSKVYRWGEDGLLGLTDRQCRLCFGLGLWNGKDPILKERLFGLTGDEGNHGEDVKEVYYYTDSTPTHSVLKMRYLYPMTEYPYEELTKVNKTLSKKDREYELEDTGVFNKDRYWEVTAEYAKADANDILIKITVTNMSDTEEKVHVIPQLWFRNTWSFNAKENLKHLSKPSMQLDTTNTSPEGYAVVVTEHETLGSFALQGEQRLGSGAPCPCTPLFTENEDNAGPYVKNAFHRRIVDGEESATNSDLRGTKAGLWYATTVPPKESAVFRLRLFNPDELVDAEDAEQQREGSVSRQHSVESTDGGDSRPGSRRRLRRGSVSVLPPLDSRVDCEEGFANPGLKSLDAGDLENEVGTIDGHLVLVRAPSKVAPSSADDDSTTTNRSKLAPKSGFGAWFDEIFSTRQREADEFYDEIFDKHAPEEQRRVARLSYAGMLCSKQFYYYSVAEWLKGDPQMPAPPDSRRKVRNTDWEHLFNRDVISMPDKWEYPWYASWDLAFHMIPLSVVDPEFAKTQLELFLREWYMHPNGQIPAYEWAFSDVNPPVHAWSCFRVYEITRTDSGGDIDFLARTFHKLLLNFTWWVNRKDPDGEHLFSGGFLGLDNIGLFDRSKPLPVGGKLRQADGTAWMAQFAASMMNIALELAVHDQVYEDVACKFFEHYISISEAINGKEGEAGLWDEVDGFYYDSWHDDDGTVLPMKVRSMVGLIPLFAVRVLDEKDLEFLPDFVARTDWFLANRPELAKRMTVMVDHTSGADGSRKKTRCRLMALASHDRFVRILKRMFDEEEFLSPYGIRSLSKVHEKAYVLKLGDEEYSIQYQPEESDTAMFGGNSNWRGPVWFPVNYLLVESLRTYHSFYGEDFKVEFPTHSGMWMNLAKCADEISARLQRLFLPNPKSGALPCHDEKSRFKEGDPLFYEYFDPESGRGLGASHQTGWTGLVSEFTSHKHHKRTRPKNRSSKRVTLLDPSTGHTMDESSPTLTASDLVRRMDVLEGKMDQILALLQSRAASTASVTPPAAAAAAAAAPAPVNM